MIDKLSDKLNGLGGSLKNFKNLDFFKKINEIIDYLNGVGAGAYKTYSILISQSGTDDPETIILKSDLGYTPTCVRSNAGTYVISGFQSTENKMLVLSIPYIVWSAGSITTNISIEVNDVDGEVTIISRDAGVTTDSLLNRFPIEIRIYV